MSDENSQTLPFHVIRRVRWGECDPAGISYTPRTLDWAVEALEDFYREVVGITWYRLNWTEDMGSPMVRAEIDYLRGLRADDVFRVEVRVERVGTSSVSYRVDGLRDGGDTCFRARLVACFVEGGHSKSIDIPPHYRQRIVDYQAACGDAAAGIERPREGATNPEEAPR